MEARQVYQVRVLRRAGARQELQLACTPAELMVEAHRLRRDPDARAVEVLHEGEHLYALA